MQKSIDNIKDLEKALQPVLIGMVNEMAHRVYETLNYFLRDYYVGWTPQSYQRTRDFLYSAVKVEAKPYRNGVVKASVYIDYKSMNHYVNMSGYQVAQWANQGLHGGLSVSHKPHVWDETINNGSLLKLAIQYLKSKGFSVSS